MATLDSLPADQRAVIQLVLQRGRTYDEIAEMLSIDRAAVRQRALDALDALGPGSSVAVPQRALLTDYLLGQLPGSVADEVRDRLADSPQERAWLRVIASELAPLARSPLPEIPAAGSRQAVEAPPETVPAASAPAKAPVAAEPAGDRSGSVAGPSGGLGGSSSRRGGAILLGLGALVIAAVVIVLIATGGGPNKKASSSASTPASTSTGSTTPSTTTTASKAKLLGQVNLVSPTGAKGTAGVAQVIGEGSTTGVVLVAQGVPPNTKSNAYALWLYNSSADSKLVGFVSQRVGSTGKLETEGQLPSNAAHYKQMLVTLETQSKPKAPGHVVLEGSLHLS